ncbi:unnamed protein product [Enterobius vermicularis]|uniref:39S ribosomal protein L32, mitochondrial n=1 Tax=Enterobius vermicularis TaxID=51028 RepID=A0A0N4V877_ENTVE|nr:unnamed protein product [Enterobius vermicularis]
MKFHYVRITLHDFISSKVLRPKVRTRKFSYTRLIIPVKNLVCCPDCGSFHEPHTICGTCYEEVRKKTNEMKKTFMNYNPYMGEKQQIPDASLEVWRGKRIVEAKKPQESWFRKIYRHESNE